MSTGGTGVSRRRWPRALAGLAVLLVAASILATYVLQPTRLTALILAHASRTLHLDLRTTGPGSYALRPEPRLVLPGLSARVPGASVPFFRSGRVELALPWDTLRGRSTDISSIVLQSPDLDMPALQHWLATRPQGTAAFKLPRLTHGFKVDDGTLRGTHWRVEHLALSLPFLANGMPTQLSASGNLLRGASISRFSASMTSTPAAIGNGVRIDASRIAFTSDGELPSLTATGSMLASNAYTLNLTGAMQRIPPWWAKSIDSAFTHPGDTPFSIVVSGGVSKQSVDGAMPGATPANNWRLQLTLGDPKRQPTLTLDGEGSNAQTLEATLHGQLSRWPDAWPGLPARLASIAAPIMFDASYQGSFFLSAPIVFDLKRANTSLHGQFRITDIGGWVAKKFGAMLPTIAASLSLQQIGINAMNSRVAPLEVRDGIVAPVQPAARPAVVPKL